LSGVGTILYSTPVPRAEWTRGGRIGR
jgi:hypothetical protein